VRSPTGYALYINPKLDLHSLVDLAGSDETDTAGFDVFDNVDISSELRKHLRQHASTSSTTRFDIFDNRRIIDVCG
jgi:hypothetical protein